MTSQSNALGGLILALGLVSAAPALAQPHPAPSGPHGPAPSTTNPGGRFVNDVVRQSDFRPIDSTLRDPINWTNEAGSNPNEATSFDSTPGGNVGGVLGAPVGQAIPRGGGSSSEGGGDSVMSDDGYETVSYSSIYGDYSIEPGDQGPLVTALADPGANDSWDDVPDVLCGQ
jgi:hypothetical protein